MFSLLKRQLECRELWEVLENADRSRPWQSVLAEATPEQRAHAAICGECHRRLEDIAATRDLLSVVPPQSDISRPWFASRVMSAVAAREAELGRALSAWAVVPKLASRLAWATALAILMVVTLIYQKPTAPPSPGEPSPESLFDNSPSQASHDDLLISMVEKE
jgi:hypothetical protein